VVSLYSKYVLQSAPLSFEFNGEWLIFKRSDNGPRAFSGRGLQYWFTVEVYDDFDVLDPVETENANYPSVIAYRRVPDTYLSGLVYEEGENTPSISLSTTVFSSGTDILLSYFLDESELSTYGAEMDPDQSGTVYSGYTITNGLIDLT
jgi:hypothetical protein